jgi:hypothetical protein
MERKSVRESYGDRIGLSSEIICLEFAHGTSLFSARIARGSYLVASHKIISANPSRFLFSE